jgi:lysozyme family protein
MINEIITDILKAEGWDTYTNRPNDRGGPTKWGITEAAYGGDVRNITEAEARLFYHRKYIIEPRFDEINPTFLLALVVDAGVNHGPKRAAKWLQRAVGATQDGRVGAQTLAAVRGQDPIVTSLKFLSYRVKFYGYLVTRDPSQAEFAHGWNNRAAKWIERVADYYTGG